MALKRSLAALLAALLLAGPGWAATDKAALPSEVVVNGVEFVLIPEGWFYKTGGIPEEGAVRFRDEFGGGNVRIWLDSFYLAKYEARARDLVAYLNSAAGADVGYEGVGKSCSVGVDADGSYVELGNRLPATHLSWEQVDGWARWMGFRLPTEAEWEKGARGTDQRLYPWGNAWPDDTYARFKTWSECSVEPVDYYRKGISPYGLYNMSGNVREFVEDWYSFDYDRSLTDGMRNPEPFAQGSTDPENPPGFDQGPWKMVKGGRWGSTAEYIRISYRIPQTVEHIFRCNGARFALDTSTVLSHLDNGTAQIINP